MKQLKKEINSGEFRKKAEIKIKQTILGSPQKCLRFSALCFLLFYNLLSLSYKLFDKHSVYFVKRIVFYF